MYSCIKHKTLAISTLVKQEQTSAAIHMEMQKATHLSLLDVESNPMLLQKESQNSDLRDGQNCMQ